MKLRLFLIIVILVKLVHVNAQLPEINIPTIPAPDFKVYISISGNDNNEGTLEKPLATFEEAIKKIPFDNQKNIHGEVVFLAGDYYPTQGLTHTFNEFNKGNFFKNISVVGDGEVNIHGDNTPEGSHLLTLRGSGIRIENINLFDAKSMGISISNPNQSGFLDASSQMTNVIIRNVLVDGSISHGILSRLVENLLFENITVTQSCQENTGTNGNCQWGSSLRTGFCKNVIIRDCEVYQNRGEGINLASSTNVLVENNVSYDNFAPNIYCIRTNKAIFRNNLVYNRDTIYWRNCKSDDGGVPQKRKPTGGFSISNEVNYDDFFSNDCKPERTYENGLFTNSMADSIFFYNNILILAPFIITDDSNGNCFFPALSHSNNFSNIFIENNTFIGDISEDHTYKMDQSFLSLVFDLNLFRGCFPNIDGKGKYRAENLVFKNNILGIEKDYDGVAVNPASIFYGGRPCNGGSLGSKFSASGNLWKKMPAAVIDQFDNFKALPNFLFNEEDGINDELLTFCDPVLDLESIIPDYQSNTNFFAKLNIYSDYIAHDFFGNKRGELSDNLSNIGAIEDRNLVNLPKLSLNSEDFKLYPNPNSGTFYMSSEKHQFSELHIQVYNAFGQIIRVENSVIHNDLIKIDLNAYPKGIYYIHVRSNSILNVNKILFTN